MKADQRKKDGEANGIVASSSASLPPPPSAEFAIEWWPIGRPRPYDRNARRWTQSSIEKIAQSIKTFGFRQPLVCDKNDVIVIGHLRLAAAQHLGLIAVPVHRASDLTPGQIRALRIADNRLHEESDWLDEVLSGELIDLRTLGTDLLSTGFSSRELSALLDTPNAAEDEIPQVPIAPVSQPGDLWLLGPHRVLCGDSTNPASVALLLRDQTPTLMVTDPPYGIRLDTEWRDRAGLNGHGPDEACYMKHRTEGHQETTISGDTRADWSDAFALAPSIEVAFVWHASVFTREVLNGLEKIGFLYPQQIIWNKGRTVLTRTHYWYQHEPCWYVRRKNAPWFGKAGENSTVWDAASPKFMLGSSDEEKFDHPTQKPVELMRKPILNHTERGGFVYDPFLGSGTTLAAAELTGRVCLGLELDPKFVDVIVMRWEKLTGREAVLDGPYHQTFEQARRGRRMAAEDAIGEEVLQMLEERERDGP
jgi:DNA modification methylase